MELRDYRILVADAGRPPAARTIAVTDPPEAFRIIGTPNGEAAIEAIVRDQPHGAFVSLFLPDVSGIVVARCAATYGVPTIILAERDGDIGRLREAGCPILARPRDERQFLAAARSLVTATAENLERLRAGLRRLERNRDELAATLARSRAIHERVSRDYAGRLGRKSTLFDDWDVVRAAQHMIEAHGRNAARIAYRRADEATEIQVVQRWRAIAQAISKIDHRD
jgi:hypothetical protein